MGKRTTMFAIIGAVIAIAVIAYLVSRPRIAAGAANAPAPGSNAGGGSAQRTDESRAASIVGAGLGAAGDIVGALA